MNIKSIIPTEFNLIRILCPRVSFHTGLSMGHRSMIVKAHRQF
ncbi:MAG: hypothetical protein U9N85_10390 [Bacteroidota bacterium]|nr:hypothetical protein [Bacteroidota bacterium]